MKIKTFLFFIVILMAVHRTSFAQDIPCLYRLELKDAGGDGWDGAQIIFNVNFEPTIYTLTEGDSASFFIPLFQSDFLQVIFIPGNADEEIAFSLISETGTFLFNEIGEFPFRGNDFFALVNCPVCPNVPISSVSTENIKSTTATIQWLAPDTLGQYLIEISPGLFFPGGGDSIIGDGDQLMLDGLLEKTMYSFYISSFCSTDDTSRVVGPYFFETPYTNDVGAQQITEPFSDCRLPANDSVGLILKNFGSAPQSLIPFAYGVNMEPLSIDMPRDGIYTGVLGQDSIGFTEFDQTYDFSTPGAYFIEVWTEMEEDQDLSNDTTSLIVYNIPVIDSLPYTQDFEQTFSGWTVGRDSENPSWKQGPPTGGVINRPAQGNNIWGTNLNGKSNASELSYLLSPCMDFSSVFRDPLINFQLWLSTENNRDQFWLESSIDGGISWQRVKTLSYNGSFFSYTGDNPSADWERQFGTLEGLSGEPDVRLRFVYFSDFATELEGIGIDDIQIFEPIPNDLLLQNISYSGDAACAIDGEQNVSISIANLGIQPVGIFNLKYQVNDGQIQTKTFDNDQIESNETAIFDLDINTETSGTTTIVAWLETPGDENPNNDSLSLQLFATYALPFSENFESGTLPSDWRVNSEAMIVTNGHNNSSFVISQNLKLQSPILDLISPALGPIELDDTLSFDYRFIDFVTGQAHTLNLNDRVEIRISDACDPNFEFVTGINQSTHTTTTAYTEVKIPLDDYVGRVIRFQVIAFWGGGSYWFDLDNFQIGGCKEDLQLRTDRQLLLDGNTLITVTPTNGQGPFTFEWTTGQTSASILAPKDIFGITVIDQFGCSGESVFLPVSVDDIPELESIRLYPNPTQGNSVIQATLSSAVDIQLVLLNKLGQTIWQNQYKKVTQLNEQIDLSNTPKGIYTLRLKSKDGIRTLKLLNQ
ncbi:MAG: T9SS type A sorting domain-containing protein [Bacteroidota bacterium]